MKSRIVKLINPGLFALAYIPYLAINMTVLFNVLPIERYFLAFFAIWGICVAVKEYLLSGFKVYYLKKNYFIIAFLVICACTMLINFRYGGFKQLARLAICALSILLLYPMQRTNSKSYLVILERLSLVLGIVISILLLISLAMCIDMSVIEITNRSGVICHMGFYENRLYGVFSSANVGGMYAIILVWLSWCSAKLANKHKKMTYIRSVIQTLISLAYISVALSKGTYLFGSVFLVTLVFLYPSRKDEKSILKILVIKLLMIAILSTSIYGAITLERKVIIAGMDWNFQRKISYMSEDERADYLEKLRLAQLGFDGRVEAQSGSTDISNKRFGIWISHLQILDKKTIFTGVNDPYKYYNAKSSEGVSFSDSQKYYIEWAKGNTHNGYIQILVSCGAFALTTMGMYLIFAMVQSFIFLIKNRWYSRKHQEECGITLVSLCLPIVVTLVADNLVETNLVLMGTNFFTAVVWFAAGACFQAFEEKDR